MLPVHYRLRRLDEAPPGGFNCHIPETGAVWSHERNFATLAERVFTHLQANGLDPTTAFERIHRATTERLRGQGHNEWVEAYQPQVETIKRSMVGVAFGVAAWVKIQTRLAVGDPVFVESEVAEKRAAVCAACPKNVQEQRTPAAAAVFDARIKASLEARETSLDARLGRCSVCSCNLTSAVHFHNDVIRSGTPGGMVENFPSHCWKRAVVSGSE